MKDAQTTLCVEDAGPHSSPAFMRMFVRGGHAELRKSEERLKVANSTYLMALGLQSEDDLISFTDICATDDEVIDNFEASRFHGARVYE